MRKIKFRAKSKLTNEWLYSCMILQTGSPNVQFIARLDENHKIDLELIKPETLGEFTGLQDADGKDIYEGDIVYVIEDDTASAVEFAGGSFVVFEDIDLFEFYEQCQVVGNIHDNPELLKKGA